MFTDVFTVLVVRTQTKVLLSGGSHGLGRTQLALTCSAEGWTGKVAAFRVQSAAHQVSRGMIFFKQWNMIINTRLYIWHIHDTTLTAESEEELKSLLMKVKKENKKDDLKLNIQKTKIMAFDPISSVQFSCRSVVSDSLWPHGSQHARPPCPSQTLGVYSNSCPLSQWCHPTISSSVIPFSSCLQSFPASGSFPKSQFFTSGDQSIGVSASASVLPMNIQDWFP